MPSLLHEGIIALVRERPELAADLLRELLHVSLPAFTEARLAEASLNDLVPTEYHADAVVLLVEGQAVFGIILEAQLHVDRHKPFTWPMYAVSARARYRCPFVVLVVTPDAETARWAAKTVDLGGGLAWRAFVVGPEGIPVITDVAVAVREPHLAVLSVMAHGRDDDVPTAVAVATAAAMGAAGLPESLKMLCFALIESSLGEAARKSFEMLPQGQQFFSETQRAMFAQGKAEGKVEGKAEGKAEGRAEGEARSILRVLERRGLAVSAQQHERILGCPDLATLEGWLDKAVTAVNTEELFAVEPANPLGAADRRNRR
jgi:hypothetical protein